jgi:two-component system response regulator HydG
MSAERSPTRAARPGLFRQANGGTLFLDEIGDLPQPLQPKLLRALHERVVRPLGNEVDVPFDVRLMAATNRDLEAAVEDRQFREDLYFRINVIRLELPPLRARGGDILLLVQRFIDQYARQAGKPVTRLLPAVAERLLAYAWLGNVRELQNCIERAVALTRAECIGVDDLPEQIRLYRHSHVVVAGEDPSELSTLEEVERRYILRVIEVVSGHRTAAARILGLDHKTLYRKLERYAAEPGAST